jgi:RimJ/RimL family protein N-acetyltransferase
MAAAHTSNAQTNVSIDAGEYLIRTLTADDASDRWAAWMADPEVRYSLNIAPRRMTRVEIANYIKTFDQRSSLLWGIFDKRTGTHIGFFTVQADYARNQGLVNLLIGEPGYRNHGVLSTIRRRFAEYFFETLGLRTMMATALARNEIIVNTLLKAGWTINQTLKQKVADHATGTKLDLCLLSLSRETWRARNKPKDRPV